MDSISAVVNSFRPLQRGYEDPAEFQEAAKTYLAALEKLPHNLWQSIVSDPGALLKAINLRENTLGYCFVLHYLLHSFPAGTIPHDTLSNGLVSLFTKFEERHIRMVLPQFKELIETVTQSSVLPPSFAIELVACVIRRSEPNRSVFTSAHLNLAKLIYDAGVDDGLAQDVLDADILFFPRTSPPARLPSHRGLDEDSDAHGHTTTLLSDIHPATVLEYHYVRALTFMRKGDWARALAALEQVITHPTKDKAVSMFMTEAHKKWLLVGLLAHGRAPSLPSHVTAQTKAVYNLSSAPYAEVASLFSTDNASDLKAAVERHLADWTADENQPLVLAVLAAFQKWQIINLRRMFDRLSISQIHQITLSAETASALSSDDAVAALVGQMIASGMLRGELELGPSGAESYLKFHDDCDAMTEADFAAAIARTHANVDILSKQYRATSQRLSTNPAYIRHLARQQKLQEREVDPGVGFDATIEDEDLMTGVMSHM